MTSTAAECRTTSRRCCQLRLAQRSQAARADSDPAGLAILNDGSLLNVYLELALGVSHGVADIMTELRGLATDFAFCHWMSASAI